MIKIKTPEQIKGIRQSSRLSAQTLDHISSMIIPGATTQTINDEVERFMRSHGAIPATLGYKGFPAASCISINEVICHGIPGPQVLKEGDIVNVDVTSILNGYYGDTSRMYAIGNISTEARRLLDATKDALCIGIEEVRPGNQIGNIGYAIYQFASKVGYSVVYQFAGHGVGLEFHEEPQISHTAPKDSGPIMAPGMIFTIEPMYNTLGPSALILPDGWTAVTVDGGLSAQYEHTVLVTDTGYEILSLSE